MGGSISMTSKAEFCSFRLKTALLELYAGTDDARATRDWKNNWTMWLDSFLLVLFIQSSFFPAQEGWQKPGFLKEGST